MAGSSPPHRFAVRVLERLSRRLWGFPPRLLRFVVAELGPVRALAWFLVNLPRYRRTVRVLGPLRTHLVCLTVSLVNNCRYCVAGHSCALELVHLQQHDRIFPADTATLSEWAGLPPKEIRNRLADLLRRAGLPLEVVWVDRTLALMDGQQTPIDRSEARVAHLTRMVGMLNTVGRSHDTASAGAPYPANPDTAPKPWQARARAATS